MLEQKANFPYIERGYSYEQGYIKDIRSILCRQC